MLWLLYLMFAVIKHWIPFSWQILYLYILYFVALVLESHKWKRSSPHGKHKRSITAEEDWSEVQSPLYKFDKYDLFNVSLLLCFTLKFSSSQQMAGSIKGTRACLKSSLSVWFYSRVFTAITKSHPQHSEVVKSDLDKSLPNIQDIQSAFVKIRNICVIGEPHCIFQHKEIEPLQSYGNDFSFNCVCVWMCTDPFEETEERWLSSVENSRWLEYVRYVNYLNHMVALPVSWRFWKNQH